MTEDNKKKQERLALAKKMMPVLSATASGAEASLSAGGGLKKGNDAQAKKNLDPDVEEDR